ncbi:MAG: FxsA family protein [Pseudomonadota bacterium]
MLRWLSFAIIALIFAEIYVFAQAGAAAGGLAVIGLTLATAAIGFTVAQYQGFQVWRTIDARMRAQEPIGIPVAHGALITAAGVLLFIPGFVGDTIGLILLIPPVRTLMIEHLLKPWIAKVKPQQPFDTASASEPGPTVTVLEGSFTEDPEENKKADVGDPPPNS